MISTDTDVVSELSRPTPKSRVIVWLENSSDLTITTVTVCLS